MVLFATFPIISAIVFTTNSLMMIDTCDEDTLRCTKLSPHCFSKSDDINVIVMVGEECDARTYRCQHPLDPELSQDECIGSLGVATVAYHCDESVTCAKDITPHCYNITSKEVAIVFGDCANRRYKCRNPDQKEMAVFTSKCFDIIDEKAREVGILPKLQKE
ncbi:hypothetical protein Trydic_g14296 [Trypoxylus dichotomus]